MARNGKYNKDFWKKLDNVGKVDTQRLYNIIQRETEEQAQYIREMIPYLYGGLKLGVYSETNITPHGITAKLGIDNDKHVNLRGMKSYDTGRLVYKPSKNDNQEGNPDNWVPLIKQHKGPLVRTDKITNRQLGEILLHKKSSTDSQDRMEAVVDALDMYREYVTEAVQDYFNSKGGKR